MPIDIAELERLAKAATPGPWEYASSFADWNMPILHIIKARGVAILEIEGVMPSPIGGSSKERQRFADAAYIAAANPHAVLALIERVRELETQTQWARAGQAADQERAERLANENGTLKERVRELENVAPQYMHCPKCGDNAACDEDGCCTGCGSDTFVECAGCAMQNRAQETERKGTRRLTPLGRICYEVCSEVARAQSLFAPMHGPHEALAVILEEFEEYKAEVWRFNLTKGRDTRARQREELIQLAAMAVRAVLDTTCAAAIKEAKGDE